MPFRDWERRQRGRGCGCCVKFVLYSQPRHMPRHNCLDRKDAAVNSYVDLPERRATSLLNLPLAILLLLLGIGMERCVMGSLTREEDSKPKATW
jgi:hypothetical protein